MAGATPPFGWTLPDGYTFDNLAECSTCQAPIAWAWTPKGNRIPMNADGVTHFATCPNAADHRRPRSRSGGIAPGDPRYVPGPPTTGDENSREAADAIAPDAGTLRDRVLSVIRDRPEGITEWELEEALGLDGNTVRPRLAELEARGMVHREGKKVRPSSGRNTWLYHATKEELGL